MQTLTEVYLLCEDKKTVTQNTENRENLESCVVSQLQDLDGDKDERIGIRLRLSRRLWQCRSAHTLNTHTK